MSEELLRVENLSVQFATQSGIVTAISGLSFHLNKKETLCIVGESGSGKSVTALAIMGLLPQPAGRVSGGEIWFKGQDLLKLKDREMQKIRGNGISMIFQEPMTTLNPVYTVGYQIGEVLRKHKSMKKKEAMEYAAVLLEKVGVPNPEKRVRQYPHELSGGLRQRVMISMALACGPSILIADEPTTALDVTVQAQVLELLNKLKEEFQMSVIFITHDLGVVSQIADRIIVLYGGMKLEESPARRFFEHPTHPYTRGLLECIPRLEPGRDELPTIPGTIPSLKNMPAGCRFSNRCSRATQRCRQEVPQMRLIGPDHSSACFVCEKEV